MKILRNFGKYSRKLTAIYSKKREIRSIIICQSDVLILIRRWEGHAVRIGERRGVCRVLVGKPEGKRPLGRPRRRWQDNINMDIQEVGYGEWNGSS